MFNKKRAPLLYWALGIAGAVITAAGTGTWLFLSRGRNKRDVAAHAKRVIAKTRKTTTSHAKATHAKTNHHAKNGIAHHAHTHTR
jgi:hypothetical protein